MGANATTSVPAYVAGEVLTAADLTVTNSGIPVFSDSTARTNGFGGTGEKALAEGQYAYLESDDKTYVYDGSAWKVVGSSGLVYVTGADFSAVSSVSFATNTFTSTYRNYRVIFDITSSSSATSVITARMRASGTDDSGANYSYGFAGMRTNGTAVSIKGSSQTSFGLGFVRTGSIERIGLTFDVIDPQVAFLTRITGTLWGSDDVGGDAAGFGGGGLYNATTAFDAMTFISGTGTITGTYRVFGYADS